MSGEVVLSSALRSNLLSLQRTQSSIDKVQNVLATGLKVSSALDNPQNFFASQALKNRSSDLTKLLDGIGQSIQTVKAADAGVSSLTKLVEQAQSIADSARDAITNGSKEAAVTGDVNLKGTTDLTSITGIANNSRLQFSAVDSAGKAITLSTANINIATGDSVEELMTKINDIVDNTTGSSIKGKQLFSATLTSGGQLKITGKEGITYALSFDSNNDGAAATAANGVVDTAFAKALGFGSVAKAQANGAGGTGVAALYDTGFTASNNTKLTSGTFYTNVAGTKASASTALVSVMDTDGGGVSRFASNATNSASINITVNDKAVVNIAFTDTTTIQGLVDSINSDSTLKSLVKASYDATAGSFSIEAISSTVQTVKIGETDGSTAGFAHKADFDFGVKAGFTNTVDLAGNSENFVLASAASTLSQLETDYNTVRTQISELVEDAGYRGVNLLKGDTLDTYFNEDRSNKLSTKGADLSSDGLGMLKANFSRADTIEATATQARGALSSLRAFGGTLSNSLSIIQTREDFTKNLVSTLTEGSDKLTLADQNEEGAKLLALQTRQSLGVTALSLAAQAQQSVLRLF